MAFTTMFFTFLAMLLAFSVSATDDKMMRRHQSIGATGESEEISIDSEEVKDFDQYYAGLRLLNTEDEEEQGREFSLEATVEDRDCQGRNKGIGSEKHQATQHHYKFHHEDSDQGRHHAQMTGNVQTQKTATDREAELAKEIKDQREIGKAAAKKLELAQQQLQQWKLKVEEASKWGDDGGKAAAEQMELAKKERQQLKGKAKEASRWGDDRGKTAAERMELAKKERQQLKGKAEEASSDHGGEAAELFKKQRQQRKASSKAVAKQVELVKKERHKIKGAARIASKLVSQPRAPKQHSKVPSFGRQFEKKKSSYEQLWESQKKAIR